MNNKLVLIGGSITLLLAICLGAFGAHGLEGKISADAINSYKTGVDYQIYHGLAILLLVIIGKQFDLKLRWAVRFIFIGVILFSGSIYLLALKTLFGIESFAHILGPITPIGGLSFIIGWCIVIMALFKVSK
ncbi:MAG: DUF423 domain-containing protein [Flavobacteriales bacterium]|nr:DUF423 domain-containing protein [Flavobacteriales bacterium]